MAVEQTLSIIKPDATRRNITGAINARLEEAGLRIVAQKRIRLSRDQAEAFYDVHKERPFYDSLCTFMTSGPVVVQVLGALVLAAHEPALPAAVTAPVSSKVSSTNAVSVQAVTVPSVSTTSLCEDRKPPTSPRKLLSSVSESDGG